jgi:hypothetical protein
VASKYPLCRWHVGIISAGLLAREELDIGPLRVVHIHIGVSSAGSYGEAIQLTDLLQVWRRYFSDPGIVIGGVTYSFLKSTDPLIKRGNLSL